MSYQFTSAKRDLRTVREKIKFAWRFRAILTLILSSYRSSQYISKNSTHPIKWQYKWQKKTLHNLKKRKSSDNSSSYQSIRVEKKITRGWKMVQEGWEVYNWERAVDPREDKWPNSRHSAPGCSCSCVFTASRWYTLRMQLFLLLLETLPPYFPLSNFDPDTNPAIVNSKPSPAPRATGIRFDRPKEFPDIVSFGISWGRL